MDKSREQFEKWYNGLGLPEGITDERLLDIYKRMLLTAWTVSRREIEIRLPKPKEGVLPGDYHIGYDAGAECQWENTVETIKEMGLRVVE